MYIRTYMLPYVYGPYIFFRPCVCAENRGKNIKKKIFFFLLWRLARDAAVRVVVVGCCAQRLFPQPLTPWKPGVTHAHVLCDKLAFCCCCRLLLCCFPSQTILYFFSTNWLFYWITQAAGGSPRLFPQEPSSSSGLRDYIGLNRRGVSPSPATITSRAFKDIASACLLASLWNFLLSFSSLCVWLK